jgi:hypothetical protein
MDYYQQALEDVLQKIEHAKSRGYEEIRVTTASYGVPFLRKMEVDLDIKGFNARLSRVSIHTRTTLTVSFRCNCY